MIKKSKFELTSAALHILAMIFMLCDHLWATIIPGNQWLTCIGRLAYPIFAFLIVEGYCYTRNLRSYVKRLLILAAITEIPFNLMYGSGIIYPFHQNVIWTFLIGFGAIRLNERAKKTGKLWKRILWAVLTVLLGYILGYLTMVDYYGVGILTILMFYFFRGRKWWNYALQAAAMYWMNVEMLGGLYYPVEILGYSVNVVEQGLAVFALLPIWLYRGSQGYHKPWFRWFCYGFYPLHMLILYVISF